MLFNIYIEELFTKIKNVGLKILGYADDLVILTKNCLEAHVAIRIVE